MATLSIIIWMIVAFLFFKEFSILMSQAINSDEKFISPKAIITALILIHGIIIYPITSGVFFDLYGKFPNEQLTTVENVRLALISGFIALGAFSISSFFINQSNRQPKRQQAEPVQYSQLSPERYKTPPSKAIKFGVEVIGFISAVLGIVSFYLDYLK